MQSFIEFKFEFEFEFEFDITLFHYYSYIVMYQFGSGRNGQLGRGDKVESIAAYRVVPTLVEYLQTTKVMRIVCGGDHTAAIVEKKI